MPAAQTRHHPVPRARPCTMRDTRVAYASEHVAICHGGLRPDDPRWDVDQINDLPPCVSFPSHPVMVEKEGMDPFVANVNRVSFFNHEQCFRLRRIGPRATRSLRFYFDPDAVGGSFADRHRWTADTRRPFPVSSAVVEHQTFLAARAIEIALEHNADPVLIDELSLRILDDAGAALDDRRDPKPASKRTHAAHAEAVRAVEACIATSFGERLTLSVIARAARVAPTHMCRIYRDHTGLSIHQSLIRTRLRWAIRMLAQRGADSSEVAHACGFSSRSHLSDSMRRALGIRPSDLRHRDAQRLLKRFSADN